MTTIADATLLARLRSNDPEAFAELVRIHRPRMQSVARRFCANPADAADALQDALVAAHAALERFEGTAQIGTWLHRITVNACLMRLRARRRRLEESLETAGGAGAPSAPGPATHASQEENAELQLARLERAKTVREEVERLPESLRRVVVLRDLEELSTEDAARSLGITPNAVKIRLHRARAALRERLAPALAA
jgi:RNA polymerase sigma-70 factor (ECF subfamily)